MKPILYIVCFVAFIDQISIGLVYPLFSSMLFDFSLPLVSQGASPETRGLLLAILIALMPLASFFSAPLWGALSDTKGRKKPLELSILLGVFGYFLAFLGVSSNNLILLILSRLFIGVACGNLSIIQASIADLSSSHTKIFHFNLYSAALGAGFMLGPFLGGLLATQGYAIPFLFAKLVMLLNWIVIHFFFKETHAVLVKQKLTWKIGFLQLQRAFHLQDIKAIVLCTFLHQFAWSYFFEFIPVYFITHFHFSPTQLGFFYGATGGFYALSTGLLTRPLNRRLKEKILFLGGNLFGGLTILAIAFLPSPYLLYPLLFLNQFAIAFVMPNAITIVSNATSLQGQGEALGILNSVSAFAFALSPIISGSLIGKYPVLSIGVGGSMMLICTLVGAFTLYKKNKTSG